MALYKECLFLLGDSMVSGKQVLFWIEKYEKKIGSFFDDWDIQYYPFVHIFNDGSFFTYGFVEGKLEIGNVSASWENVYKVASQYAKRLGLKYVSAITSRNGGAFKRLTKSTIIESRIINDKVYHYAIKEVE